MRKMIMIAALLTAVLTTSAQEQTWKNEVGVYYGFGAISNIVSNIGEGIFETSEKSGYWGPIGIEYYHHFTPVLSVGAIASVAGCKWKNIYGTDTNDKTTYYSVMPAAKFSWIRKQHFGLYSGLALGILVLDQKAGNGSDKASKTDVTFSFQFTGIGAEYGSAFRVFGEAGFGEKGILTAGLRYKF